MNTTTHMTESITLTSTINHGSFRTFDLNTIHPIRELQTMIITLMTHDHPITNLYQSVESITYLLGNNCIWKLDPISIQVSNESRLGICSVTRITGGIGIGIGIVIQITIKFNVYVGYLDHEQIQIVLNPDWNQCSCELELKCTSIPKEIDQKHQFVIDELITSYPDACPSCCALFHPPMQATIGMDPHFTTLCQMIGTYFLTYCGKCQKLGSCDCEPEHELVNVCFDCEPKHDLEFNQLPSIGSYPDHPCPSGSVNFSRSNTHAMFKVTAPPRITAIYMVCHIQKTLVFQEGHIFDS